MPVTEQWFDLTGKVALVTGGGANGGNGHAIALGLAQYGADVLVSDIDLPGAEQTVAEVQALGRRALAVRCDTGSQAEIMAMFGALDAAFGRLDILVNNVGIGHRERPEVLDYADWQRVVRVNLDGTFLCSQEAGRRLIAQGGGGSIINISSIAGSSALGRGNFVYSVTKGGINQLTRELAVEWSMHRIRVNAIQPAQIMTPALKAIFERSQLSGERTAQRMLVGIPLDRFGQPEDVARAAVFLASPAAAFMAAIWP
jgi:NAD(P)-dependent dehydrogenase (short-subunit alcohol dehydrogenase family)